MGFIMDIHDMSKMYYTYRNIHIYGLSLPLKLF